MPQHATAFPAPSNARPSVADTLAVIAETGRTLDDLRARLAAAERTVAVLRIERRALQAELRAARLQPASPSPSQPAAPEAPAQRSRLDDALAALVEGLGPAIVRAGP